MGINYVRNASRWAVLNDLGVCSVDVVVVEGL